MVSDRVILGMPIHDPSAEFNYPTMLKAAPELAPARALLKIWQHYEADGGMRMGRDIPSRKLARFLAHISIVEAIDDWADSFTRLAGQALMIRFGRDITGMRGSEIFADNQAGHRVLCELALAAQRSRKPFFMDSTVERGREVLMRMETVHFPIYGPDGAPGWHMGGLFFFDRPDLG
ncbi:MAG TPA: PAS domain-containing protein [Rhizomicrobium sp.]|nr:PAS domain-containing protein [Rhizomicrobium sp.]